MVAALASALAARDPLIAAHSARVTLLADRLATWLGWDDCRRSTLRFGASLHDIGKVTISKTILRKRGPLTPVELAEIRTHPAVGAKLIGSDGHVHEALPYVLYHHERWDGCGYPTRRGADEIPEGARLLAVVDAYDAMISLRPYRPALTHMRALGEIERCAGSQFDPTFASAFLAAWQEGAFDLPYAASS